MERFEDLNLAHLKTFQLVINEGGYAAAARVSHLSVPSVWQHIHALERAYGVPLFDRVGRVVRPTAAALRLSEHLDSILIQLDSTFDVVSEARGDKAIRIVAAARMVLEDLAAPLATFQKTHSNQIVIRQGNDRRAEELLLDDQSDLAIALEPGLKRKSSLIHYEPAYTVEFFAVAKKTHPYIKTGSDQLIELARHELIVTLAGTHTRDAVEQSLHREGLSAKIVVETDNSAYTIACAAAGMGVGIVAGRTDGVLSKRLAKRLLSQHLGQRRIVLMWRKGRILSDAMIDLVEQIKQIDLPS